MSGGAPRVALENAEVRMLNDIAAQFDYLSDDAAAAAVAQHVDQFWEPRMRAQIRAYVAEGGSGLSPRALAAVERMRV